MRENYQTDAVVLAENRDRQQRYLLLRYSRARKLKFIFCHTEGEEAEFDWQVTEYSL